MLSRAAWALSLCLMFAAPSAGAQPGAGASPPQTNGGVVIDARTRKPVAGAEVMVVGRGGVERTDRDGRFHWAVAPQAPLEVIVVLPDGRVAQPIRVTELRSGADLVLEVQPALAEAMTIVGAAPAIDVSPGASATSLPTAEIALRNAATLSQTIEIVPGVGAISEGQAAVPTIRGLARGRTLILVDGGRASTERRAGPNASFLDPAAAHSIEVARGPGSVAYGSDAFGGIIAVQMRRPDFTVPLRLRLGGTFGGGVPEARGDVEVTTGYGSGGVLVAAHARKFDDYDSPAGVVPNSGWRDSGARVAWAHGTSENRWSAAWQGDFGRDLGRPRSDANTIVATSPYEDSHRVTAAYERVSAAGFRNVKVEGLLGSADQRVEQERLATTTRGKSVDRSDLTFRDVQVRATADRPIRGVRLQTGADILGRYGLRSIDTTTAYSIAGAVTSTQTTVAIESAHRTGAGLFVQAEGEVADRVRLSAGIRGDAVWNTNIGGYFGDRSVSNSALAGLVAATWIPVDPVFITAQVSRGFRDPTLSDRFYRGPVGRGFIEGNPELQPETSLQFDLTARYAAGRFRVAGAYYRYRIENLVERYLVGTSDFRFRNRGEALIHGGELEAQLGVSARFRVDITGQLSRGRDAVDSTPLDDIAPDAVSVALRYATSGRLTLDSFARVRVNASHALAGPSEVVTPGHTALEVGANWRIARAIELRGVARNLLNESYYSSAGPRWVYAPGRNGSLSFVVIF